MRRPFLILISAIAIGLIGLLVAGRTFAERFDYDSPSQDRVSALARPYRFDLVRYEITATLGKLGDALSRRQRHLSVEEAQRLVQDYNARAQRIAWLEYQINAIFADPATGDPDQASADLREERARLNALQAETRPLVEAYLEQTVTQRLHDLGLRRAGMVWPPVLFRFHALPNYLIVSPRDRIEVEAASYLRSDLDTADMTAIEDELATQLDRSTLIEGLGGLGAWPTLVLDEASLRWVLSTIVHEWVHNYLVFQPLGWNMSASPQMNTINETVATIVGDEIGNQLAYDLFDIPLPAPPPPTTEISPPPPPDPDTFDFATEMRRTRLHVDELLAAGKVDEAEAYMEQRREEFVANGYPLRKLNQAYFAFHGSYATTAASSDPIGPKLRQLRALTPDVATFLREVQDIAQADDLDRLLERWQR